MSRAGSKLFRVELEVKAYDEKGRLIAEKRKESDLILNHFKKILATLLVPFEDLALGARKYTSVVDLGGTTRTITVWANRANTGGYGLNFTGAHKDPSWPIGVRIRIGTSTVAPTRDDYKLGAEVGYGTPTQTVGADYISWAVSITLTAAADITEAGLSCFLQLGFGAVTATCEALFFRDTFTAVSVPAGGTISVTYKLTF